MKLIETNDLHVTSKLINTLSLVRDENEQIHINYDLKYVKNNIYLKEILTSYSRFSYYNHISIKVDCEEDTTDLEYRTIEK